jgi:N-acyl-D-amino-acid deacylase
VLIRNATIVDGTGGAPYTGSVLIGADTLAYVGPDPMSDVRADTVIDAAGRVVSPGFIDPHAHGDPFRTPGFENFRRMGVTTSVLGMDGSSDGADDPATYLRRVDSLNTGIGVVNAVVGYPCRAPRFGNFLAEEHKMMVFPRHFVHERTKALVGIYGA